MYYLVVYLVADSCMLYKNYSCSSFLLYALLFHSSSLLLSAVIFTFPTYCIPSAVPSYYHNKLVLCTPPSPHPSLLSFSSISCCPLTLPSVTLTAPQAYIRIGSSRCGGSLINQYHVVTAGHCVARWVGRNQTTSFVIITQLSTYPVSQISDLVIQSSTVS